MNINLDDRQTPRPTMDTLATPISNLRMGWMSQMSLQSHSNSPSHESLKRIQNKTIASSSTPNLALPKRNQEDVFREHTPFSHTDGEKISPLKRGVEGKYRSRTEAPGSSSRLRPLLLAGKGPSPPRGVVYDSNMVPGVSMTVQDLNGELVSVRSPTKFLSLIGKMQIIKLMLQTVTHLSKWILYHQKIRPKMYILDYLQCHLKNQREVRLKCLPTK